MKIDTRIVFQFTAEDLAKCFGRDRAMIPLLEIINKQQALIDRCRAAGFITPEGEVRKVLGTLPLTADGCVVGNGGRFWSPGGTACGYCMAEDHNESHWALAECYSTREAAEAARKGGVFNG